MASNNIPIAINDIFRLSHDCYTGATALGASIPLLINTAGEIGSNRANLFQLEGLYQQTLSALPGLRSAVVTARINGVDFARKARRWLENTYGHRWNQSWREAGFIHNSLEIPTDDDPELAGLLERMQIFFGNHSGQENPDPKVNVTAARAGSFAAALKTAGTNLNAKEEESGTNKKARDKAKKDLRKRLSGLVSELGQRLSDDDPRWRRFGLNVPAAPTVPAVPANLQVNTNTPGEFFITCARAANATRYRFFTQRPVTDPEPVFAGTSDEPMFHLTGLTPGQAYQVFVSAANSGAESRLTEGVAAVVGGSQSAAA